MSKKLTKIDFGFENCEVGTLPIKAVPFFNLENIQKDLSHNWTDESRPANEISSDLHCENARFNIDFELAAKLKTNFMDQDISDNLAKRLLAWNNLSSVTLYYDDQSQDFIWLP